MEPSKEAPSSTGTPRMRPRRVPLYLVLATGAAATLGALSQTLPTPYEHWRPVCAALGLGIGAAVGIASPGLRK